MHIIAPTSILDRDYDKPSIFLAGTIEMGKAERWQDDVAFQLKDRYNIYNPYRKAFDADVEQRYYNDYFYRQVNWEMDAMNAADHILCHLLPDSKSPITLMEIGLYARSGKLAISCSSQFYRYGNIEILCERHNIPLYTSLGDLVDFFGRKATL